MSMNYYSTMLKKSSCDWLKSGKAVVLHLSEQLQL